MNILNVILLIALLVMALFLVIALVLQKGKGGMGTAISGGTSDTYFGNESSANGQTKLSRWTTIIGIVFVAIVLVVYIIQPDYMTSTYEADFWKTNSSFADIFKK
ncbi:MAG: preprotein translocase subunit SecG [Clostridia bacterium]|nr:preprotein translocase subunit SecG [Clostridia bacterium]MBO7150915.1 preprotein translocase subunit SecG [Clostridia bacterium]